MTIADDLAGLATATITAQPVTEDETGAKTNDGSALALTNVRITGRRVMARDALGNELVSNMQATILSFNNLTVEGFRFTLPSDWPEPRTNLKAIEIKMVEYEGSPLYEKVYFP